MDTNSLHVSHDMPMPMPGHHGGGGEGGMKMGECKMSMVWNTSTEGICVVFEFWKVNNKKSFWLTLIILFILASSLEFLRFKIRSLDVKLCSIHKLNNNLNLLNGTSHRRKASVQQVLGVSNHHPHHHHHHSIKSTGIGGPSLTTSSVGVGLGGDRRVISPSYTPTDNISNSSSSKSDDDLPLLPGGGNYQKSNGIRRKSSISFLNSFIPPLPISNKGQIHRSILYVFTLTLSMFIMLVFMTYNSWLIGAVLTGAATGHYLFNRDIGMGMVSEDKAVCH